LGFLSASGGVQARYADRDLSPSDDGRDSRRLRSRDPRELIAGRAGVRGIAHAQGYLGIGGGLIGLLAVLLPHPASFNTTGLILVQLGSVLTGIAVFAMADRVPLRALRLGPAIGTMNTTLCLYFSGDSTSGFALFYLWIALYVFYFPASTKEAVFFVAFTVANYALAIAITPSLGGAQENASYSYFVILAGTLITAGTLLTYLRSRMERLMRRLTDAARTDPLTGMPNRVALQEVLVREIERAKPEARPVSVVVLDTDRFKSFNDRNGVEAGDRALNELGSLLERGARLPDTVARTSGGEFALVLPETHKHAAFMLAEELLNRIRGMAGHSRRTITASAGVAVYPEHGQRVGELLGAADEAMRAAKALGRDRVVLYSPEVTNTLGMAGGRRSVEDQAQLATVLSLAEALDQRDSSTARHSQTVGRLCELMAEELGYEPDHVQRIRLAGILHDIGKIGVPDSILWKPGPLTSDEVEQMRRHPEIAARILSAGEMDDIRGWIRAHHERPDGKGYPEGLRGEQIPEEAAILAVADAYEAMISDRVYRMAIGPEAARDELERCSGTQFEPRVVEGLLAALDREPLGVGSRSPH
jgi:diguanylate cyclase (GGDEF)-like protein/putative nucleotidyltransferase with HDIG domain